MLDYKDYPLEKYQSAFRSFISDPEAFSDHTTYLWSHYSGPLRVGSYNIPLEWNTHILMDDIFFNQLPSRTQELFKNLVFEQHVIPEIPILEIFDNLPSVEELNTMTIERVRFFTLQRIALDYAAKICLAKSIEKNKNYKATEYIGDISPLYWHEVANSEYLVYITKNWKEIPSYSPESYYRHLNLKRSGVRGFDFATYRAKNVSQHL